MTTERKQEIVRSEVFVVEDANLNTYGDLILTTATGEERKVGNKRPHLFPTFRENIGRAIKVGYASYKDREYINEAELFDGKPPEELQIKPITAGVEKPKTSEPAPQAIGMWWKVVADLIVAGRLKEVLGEENAISALQQFRGEMVSVLRIPFDGSKFPQYKKQDE